MAYFITLTLRATTGVRGASSKLPTCPQVMTACYTSIANFNYETESDYGSEGSIFKTPIISPGDDWCTSLANFITQRLRETTGVRGASSKHPTCPQVMTATLL